jgi:tetratricopeptide (TPR) repeat protein
MYVLCGILNPMGTMDAIDFLLDKLRNTKNSAEFFESMNTDRGRGAMPPSQQFSLTETLARAVALHGQGQLDDAARLYRQLLNTRADHFEARHLLGVLRAQQGRKAEALTLIETALRQRPDDPDALFNRGNILVDLGRNGSAGELRAGAGGAAGFRGRDAQPRQYLAGA